MTTTVHTALKENSRRALKGLAIVLSVLVYIAGLVYAGVRSYDLFARTIPADLLPLALLGIVALELTALGLPIAIHYWTAPGPQRMAALGFYLLDLGLIAANAVLDAAHNAGTLLPDFMAAYGVYGVPALPIVCMVGWALVWALDPASREHDLTMAVRAATFDAMLSQVIEEAKATDISEDVRAAAAQRARAIVGETLGRARRLPAPARPAAVAYAADAPPAPDVVGESEPVAVSANGTARRARRGDAPKG